MFITFEGGEGSGKSTQVGLLAEKLRESGRDVISTREPGGVASAERIRSLLVSGSADAWDPVSETLMFYAARIEHLHRLICPALKASKTIVCDRFADSTRVYQGIGKGVSMDFIDRLHALTLEDFCPDITFILDIDPKMGLKRAALRSDDENRFESMDFAFHEKVRQGFLDIAWKHPGRCVVVNADQPPQVIHNEIMAQLAPRLKAVS
ncbi:MAG: dTMP kinase [Alphaproteobacteria bacterium]